MHRFYLNTLGRHIDAATPTRRVAASPSGASWMVPALLVACVYLFIRGLGL